MKVEQREALDSVGPDMQIEFVRYSVLVPTRADEPGTADPEVHLSVFAFRKKSAAVLSKVDGLNQFLHRWHPQLKKKKPQEKKGDVTTAVMAGRTANGADELVVASVRVVHDTWVVAVFTAPLGSSTKYEPVLMKMNESFSATWAGAEQ